MALKKISDFPNRKDLNPTPPLETIRLAGTMGTGTTARNVNVPVRDITGPFDDHIRNAIAHMTAAEHENLKKLIASFPAVIPDAPWATGVTIPSNAFSNDEMISYLSKNCVPGIQTAPGRVYVSRVPWGRWNATLKKWDNYESQVNEAVAGVSRKFMDNAPNGIALKHTCSTNTVLGADDYVGKEWAFFWEQCNYVRDEYGVKHVTAIKGMSTTGHTFAADADIGVFGPAFWYFCKTESFQKDDGTWLTDDGTEGGTPLYQLWGISDKQWSDLDQARKDELTAHGITEEDFSIWPECLVYDAATSSLVARPYWVHSAYCGSLDVSADGTKTMGSKKNHPLFNNLSYQSGNATYGGPANNVYQVIGGGSHCVNGFGMLFDIVKNATKNSQSIHMGMSNNDNHAVLATYSTSTPDYIFPISSQGFFEAGCTVRLWQTNANSTQIQTPVTTANQYGRIQSIETKTITLADGTTASSLCLVFDPTTVEPFLVRTTVAETKELTDAGQYACCYATQGIAMTGETDWVLGKHDGSVTSLANGRHPYRVQGTEYMPGAWIIGLDTVAVKGDGSTAVTVEGVTYVPNSTMYIYLIAPPGTKRIANGSLANFLSSGYIPAGVGPGQNYVLSGGVTVNGGFIINEQLAPKWGITYPVGCGGTNSSDSTGHADNFWVSANPAECRSGGYLFHGSAAGSACLYLGDGLGPSDWSCAARD